MALPTATSYLSEADADTYFATSFNAAAWTALSSAEKTVALTEATRWLETLCWKGEKCSDTQPLKWPRKADADGCCGAVACTALPEAMVQATAELALGLHQNKTAIVGGSTSSGAIKSASLGGLSVTYKDDVVTTTKVSGSAPLVLQKFPWLVDLLSPCLMQNSSGSARVLHRSCA
jgi:hypothetical protein